MPDFDTPAPISLSLEFDIGSARITAGERTDTVVEVLPTDGAESADVRAARQTKVTFADGKLEVKGPKQRSLFGRAGSLDVSVELPAGSDVLAVSPLADFVCEGALGECRIKSSLGGIQVAEAAAVNLRTDHGDVRLARVAGDAEVVGAGRIGIGRVAGAAIVKNVNGDTEIGEVTGDLRVNSSNGRISIGVAHAGVDAKSANGGIRVDEVARGKVTLQTAMGDLEVGIRESTAAWLDVNTRLGAVRNSLGPADGPGDSDSTVEVRARTGVGDIVIRRA
ncbi:DUF4097 family beta strand repeat-containing protein [Streptomyces albireticuli]|uniref:DUF4097 domain-containing protein n=1 Tax=Streptomyces albireticuli TaxID=1940 RepID=A0A2A2CZ73_9ACTN|nr:DUF4097 family beta strand repeat-containing protein [Streptomyces albireticuli]MCD9140984.1 DUF4097 family beta strand repeat-containing protein [Streptomyces albireticuli]MCD9161054.1 DUF4097 family beta strand repeat-containing protein [Streptomyces albireticuli]MCD9190888.1 DUF4097 family beta strand repeat-containing protein [Streptomyces albireticuli]PAU44459.1 hypothetical protein CK936_34780 [Streptomyces albireticuli]